MSVVIIGGHDRMVYQYEKICRGHRCSAKVFTQMSASLAKQIGRPDLVVLFTNKGSHKRVRCALVEAKRSNAIVESCHTTSKSALTDILEMEVAAGESV